MIVDSLRLSADNTFIHGTIARAMKNGFLKLETLANLAIVAVAVILEFTLLSRYFGSQPSAYPNTAALKPGVSLPTSNIDWSKNEKNLVLVLSTQCKYCLESSDFYRRLTERASSIGSLRTIAILPQSHEESTRYLAEKNIAVNEVLMGNPSELLVRGTPTLILVDKSGRALDIWVGKLPPEKETEVLERIAADIVRN